MASARTRLDGAAAARAAVGQALGAGEWTIRALGGSTGRTWLASGPREVVVRLDASAAVLARVAELGVGPALLGSGSVDGRAFVLQERVDGPAPSVRWLAEHTAEVAHLFATVAGDATLAELAEPLPAPELGATLLHRARSAGLARERVALAEALARDAPAFDGSASGATHGDPNRTNLLAGDRLLLVDWDDLRRADALRDLGPVAWWYLPDGAWPAFLAAASQPWTEAVLDRFWWWTAAESLDVALRLLADDRAAAEGFLLDFVCAARRQPNPRRDR